MKATNRLISASFAILVLFSLSACAPGTSTAPTSAPTQEVVQTVVPTATPTLSPEPTPTLNPIEQKEAEINQEIQEFLNAVGEYQDYKIRLGSLKFSDETLIERPDLGIINYRLDLQGCLIGYIENDDYIFLVTGFVNKEKERFVTILAIVRYFYEDRDRDAYFLIKQGARADFIKEEKYNHDVLLDYLNRLEGKVCGFPLTLNNISEELFYDKGFYFDWVPRYVEEANNSTEFAKRLLNTVVTNGVETRVNEIEPDYIRAWKASFGKSEPIIGLDKFDYESLSALEVPIIRQLYFKDIGAD